MREEGKGEKFCIYKDVQYPMQTLEFFLFLYHSIQHMGLDKMFGELFHSSIQPRNIRFRIDIILVINKQFPNRWQLIN